MTKGYIEKSMAVEQTDIEKINGFTRSDFAPDSLYVFSAALCNNDIDRDYEKFSLEALYQLKELFIGKTGIFDHSVKSSNQKARIFETWVEKAEGRKTADGEDFYVLKAKAYMVKSDENMPLITEIEAGIKKEVSVSCSMGKSICSICGNEKKSGRCSHFSGKEYSGKTAYTILCDAKDAYEFSFVAVPAQREAGVTKSFDFMKEEKNMTEILKTIKNSSSDITLTSSQADSLSKYIDKLNDEAQMGREYKKSLTDEVVKLCASAMPDMDLKVFSGVAQIMTTSELLSFKKAFSKSENDRSVSLQLKPQQTKNQSNNQFKI